MMIYWKYIELVAILHNKIMTMGYVKMSYTKS